MSQRVSLAAPFRGLGVQLLSYPTFWTVFFTVRGATAELAASTGCPNVVHTFLCSALGITAANPAFVIKTRMQLAVSSETTVVSKKTTRQHFAQLWRSRELFRGLGAAQMNSCKMAVQIPAYELLLSLKPSSVDKSQAIVAAAVASKVLSSAIFYPTDLIRTTQRSSEHAKLTIAQTIRHLTKPEFGGAMIGLYRGVCVSTAATLPNFVLVMFFKDYLFA